MQISLLARATDATQKRSATAVAILLSLVVGMACSDTNPDSALASAKDYLQKNDLKSATIQVKNALQVSPDLAEARFLLGTVLLKERRAAEAEIELRKALAAKYPADEVVPELALAVLMQSQSSKVIAEFGRTELGKPSAVAGLQTTLALAYGLLQKPELADAALSAALAADSNHAPALLLRARQKAALQDFDAALATVNDVLTKDARNAEAWKLKGDLSLFSKDKAADVLAAYRKSVEVAPDFLPGHFALMSALMQQDKLDEAGKQLLELKRIVARHPQTTYLEAQLAYKKKDLKLAKDLTQQLLAASQNPRHLELAGAIELQLNSLPQAEAYLAAALRASPDLQFARRLLVTTYLRSGQVAKALATLNAGVGEKGLDPSLFTVAGQAYLQNGDAKKAEEYFAKASQLDPKDFSKQTALAITRLQGVDTTAGFDTLETIAGADSGISADLALISAHLGRKEYDKALAAVAKLEAKQPGKPLAADLRGRIELARKDTAAARASFEQTLKLDPSYFAGAASLAALDMSEKKPDEARQRFERFLVANPKNSQAWLGLAELAMARRAGKDEVAGLLNKAIQANPDDVAPRLALVELYLGAKDSKQAVASAQTAVAALPNSPELLDALGRAQLEAGEVNQAIATFGKLARLQPLLPMPQLRLAAAHMSNKDVQAAEQSARKALELKPDDSQIQRGLIFILVEAKKVPEALAMARAVQKQRPKEAVGFGFEGDVRAGQKEWNAAADAYRSGLRVQPTTELAIKLHLVLTAAGKSTESDRFAATWASAHPKDSAFANYLGDAALARKDYAAAERSYRAVLQSRPDSPAALNNLAWITHELRKPGALAYAEKANALAPNQPAFMDTLAMLLSDKGEFSKAIDLQMKALALQPENGTLRLTLAKIYIASGEKTRAKAELDALAKLGDKSPSYAEASALLKTL